MIVASTARRRDSGLGRDDLVDVDDRLVMSQDDGRAEFVRANGSEVSIANSKKRRKTFNHRQFGRICAVAHSIVFVRSYRRKLLKSRSLGQRITRPELHWTPT